MHPRLAVQSAVLMAFAAATVLPVASATAVPRRTGSTASVRGPDLESEGYERLLRQRRDRTFTKAG